MNYHVFGVNMLRNQEQTGANLPCWMIFDARFRSKYPLGVMMPGSAWGDWTVPQEWFGDIIHRADSIEALARQIDIDPWPVCRGQLFRRADRTKLPRGHL